MRAARDILILGGTPWDPESNQTSGQMAGALALAGHRVMYVARVRQSSLVRDLAQGHLTKSKSDSDERLTLVSPNLWSLELSGVSSALPLSYPETLRRWQLRSVKRQIRWASERLGFEDPLLWCYWWFFPELLSAYATSVFDVVDAHDAYPSNARWPRLNAAQGRLAGRTAANATLTVAVSEALVSKYRQPGRRAVLQPNGIDLARADRALAGRVPEKGTKSWIIGYTGSTATRIDWPLVAELASAFPDATLEFHGGTAPASIVLPGNVVFFGDQPYDDILAAIRTFDVALLPFEDNEFVRASNFLKLLDYASMGVPVVAPPLPAVLDLAAKLPRFVYVAAHLDDWCAQISKARQEKAQLEIPDMSPWSSARRASEVLESIDSCIDGRGATGAPRA
jgi:glycosyltransferase involved in cell wall biosynthesis